MTSALRFPAGGKRTGRAASMAWARIASGPTPVACIPLGKYFLGGLASGAVKG